MCVDLSQVPTSTIGSIIAWPIIAVLGFLVQKRILPYLQCRKFRCIFGEDALLGSEFYAIHTKFTLVPLQDQNGNRVTLPYTKPPRKGAEYEAHKPTFKIEKPVSSAGARALSYIVTATHTNSKKPIKTSYLDYDLDTELNISFISFGGPLANYKTADVLADDANDLADFAEAGKEGFFADAETGCIIARPVRDCDHGLILKLRSRQFPERTWLVCAGFAEWGTSGAAWYLANKWKYIYRWAKKEPFAIVVQVDRGRDQSARFFWGKSAGRVWEKPPHTRL